MKGTAEQSEAKNHPVNGFLVPGLAAALAQCRRTNPSFSAKIALHRQVRRYFSYNTFFIALRFLKRYNEYGIKYLLITCNALCGERRRLYGFGRKIV